VTCHRFGQSRPVATFNEASQTSGFKCARPVTGHRTPKMKLAFRAGELQANDRALQFRAGLFEIFFSSTPGRQLLLHMLTRQPRARRINLFRPFGNFSQHRNMIVFDFNEAARDVQLQRLAAGRVGKHAGLQLRNQRCVAGKMPSSPPAGNNTASTASESTRRSGVTTSSWS
jgi:hypothetical protein